MGQSLFARLVKLGVPTVQLDAQGRARPSLSSLYSWRYKNLTDLPHTMVEPQFRLANAGFRFDVQLIDVGDYKGKLEFSLTESPFIISYAIRLHLFAYQPTALLSRTKDSDVSP